ncbi:hypothetical protein AAC387_Pa02g3516 [Persea americana]
MAEPDSSAADLQETLTNKKEEEEKDVPELEKEEEEEVDRSLQKCENPSDMETGALTLPEEEEEEDSEKTLADADELMEKGSKATKEGDYAEAVDCFSRAVEIRVAHYGELAPACATAYYNYGRALLYKAQEEADPLVSAPKKEIGSPGHSAQSATDGSVKIRENGECSGAAVVDDAKQDKGATDNVQENHNEESEDDDEDLPEADEEDSDLDLAWKMLDVARAIVEKQPGDTLEKVDILETLAEVSLEREDIETSLSDYRKALSILQNLVEPDSRRIAELNFRICLALEVGSKVEDAVPYCQKAISVCKARLQRLKAEVNNSTGSATTVDASSINGYNQIDNQLSDGAQLGSSISKKVEEIETLSGLSSELEKKLEDLQQVIQNPKSVLSEILKMVGSKSMGGGVGTSSSEGKVGSSDGWSSSRMGVIGVDSDSPTVSTATGGNVTHLGIVGRGVKRAIVTPTGAEPSPKKLSSDSSAGKEDSISQV